VSVSSQEHFIQCTGNINTGTFHRTVFLLLPHMGNSLGGRDQRHRFQKHETGVFDDFFIYQIQVIKTVCCCAHICACFQD